MKKKPKRRTTKSRDWIEAECLKCARQAGGVDIQRVTIRRLHPMPGKPNWKLADIIPLPSDLNFNRKVRDAIAHLPGLYALEDDEAPPGA
jgi:hypothetical protein